MPILTGVSPRAAIIAGEAKAKPPNAAAPLRMLRRSSRPVSPSRAMVFLPRIHRADRGCAGPRLFDIAPELLAVARGWASATRPGFSRACRPDRGLGEVARAETAGEARPFWRIRLLGAAAPVLNICSH